MYQYRPAARTCTTTPPAVASQSYPPWALQRMCQTRTRVTQRFRPCSLCNNCNRLCRSEDPCVIFNDSLGEATFRARPGEPTPHTSHACMPPCVRLKTMCCLRAHGLWCLCMLRHLCSGECEKHRGRQAKPLNHDTFEGSTFAGADLLSARLLVSLKGASLSAFSVAKSASSFVVRKKSEPLR